jgi:hypothetical protein
MSEWTSDELKRVGGAEEVQITSRRRDGTLRNPVTVWVARDGDSLYLRSVQGPTGAWFRAAEESHEGRIRAGGIEKDITFVDPGRDLDEKVDAAYRAKYKRYAGSILNSILTPQARSATVKLVPRSGRS